MSVSKSKGKGRTVTGSVLAIAITALFCGVYALLVKNGKCSQEYSELIISAAIALSVLIAVVVTNNKQGRAGLYGLLIGFIYAAIVIAVPLLAYPTEIDWLKILKIIVIATVSGFVGGNINLDKSNKSFHKKRKKKA